MQWVDPSSGMCTVAGCGGELVLQGIDLRAGGRMWAECDTCGGLVYMASRRD